MEKMDSIRSMDEDKYLYDSVVAVPTGVGNAVGLSGRRWYAARMRRNNTEKATAERLAKSGCECYVATQKVLRRWSNGRTRKIEHVVIPGLVFIRCTEQERLQLAYDPAITRFLIDRAIGSGQRRADKVAVIPDRQIDRLRFMLGQSDTPVEFTPEIYRSGDKVRVIRGNLMGLEGKVIQTSDGKSELIVSVELLGSAKLTVNTIDIERLG